MDSTTKPQMTRITPEQARAFSSIRKFPEPPKIRSFESFATYTMRYSGGYERRRVYSVLFDGNGMPERGDMVLIDGVRHRVERVMRGGEFTPPGIPIGIMVDGDVGDGRG